MKFISTELNGRYLRNVKLESANILEYNVFVYGHIKFGLKSLTFGYRDWWYIRE